MWGVINPQKLTSENGNPDLALFSPFKNARSQHTPEIFHVSPRFGEGKYLGWKISSKNEDYLIRHVRNLAVWFLAD